MAYFRQRGFGSRLLRRVLRHRDMTALFRSPTNQQAPPGPAPDITPPQHIEVPVVQAALALPQVEHPEITPVMAIPAPQPWTPMTYPTPATTPTVSTPPVATQPTIQRQATPATAQANQPVAESVTPPVSARQEDEESGISDADWNRLTNIFRKHQEKNTEEASREVTQPPAQPEPITPPRPARGITELPSPTIAQPIPVMESTPAEVAVEPSEPVEQAITATEPKVNREPAVAHEVATTIQRTATRDTPGEDPAEAVVESDEESAKDMLLPPRPASPTTLKVEPEVEIPDEPVETLDAIAPPETVAGSAGQNNAQAVVEQAPEAQASIAESTPPAVQRTEKEAPDEQDIISAPPLEQTLAADNAFGFQVTRQPPTVQRQAEQAVVKQLPSAPLPVNDEDHHELHTALEKVDAGKPTDSSIEVIPPRRPRPETHMHVQRTPSRPPGPPATQQPQKTPIALKVTEPASPPTVSTPIGPLPSDLWTLIGKPVPQVNTSMAATQPMTGSRTRSTSPQVQASMPTSPTLQRTIAQTEPVQRQRIIQRDVAIDQEEPQTSEQQTQTAEQTQPGETAQAPATDVDETQSEVPTQEQTQTPTASQDESQSETQTEEQAPAASETDLDMLAAQVYRRIKRKLNIEWERLRSKY